MASFGAAPTFTAGQILSAGFHANGLQRFVQGLRDSFVGCQTPITGCVLVDLPYQGALRHKTAVLEYSLTIAGTATPWKLYVNGGVKATFAADGTYTSSVTLTGLTVGQFYTVEIKDGNGTLTVRYLRQASSVMFPVLASFANESAPNAAQWQELATYAELLATTIETPAAPVVQVRGEPANPGALDTETKWIGTMSHRCRYLAYRFWARKPYHLGDDGGAPWVSCYIGVNGTGVLHRRNGRVTTAGPGLDFDQSTDDETLWEGVLDMDTYPGTLDPGEVYTLTFTAQDSTTLDTINAVRLDYLYEVPAVGQALTGWEDFAAWEPGNYAWGDSNPFTPARKITTIKANLELLAGYAPKIINPVTRLAEASTGAEFTAYFGVRRRRYLHYFNDAGRSVALTWMYAGKEQSTGLPDASAQWLAVDLDSLSGLWPGTAYRIDEARYAIEDETP